MGGQGWEGGWRAVMVSSTKEHTAVEASGYESKGRMAGHGMVPLAVILHCAQKNETDRDSFFSVWWRGR
jgi:hypothetical protein